MHLQNFFIINKIQRTLHLNTGSSQIQSSAAAAAEFRILNFAID